MVSNDWPDAYDDLPNDAPGGDCPDHGPHTDDDCPKCDDDDDSSSGADASE